MHTFVNLPTTSVRSPSIAKSACTMTITQGGCRSPLHKQPRLGGCIANEMSQIALERVVGFALSVSPWRMVVRTRLLSLCSPELCVLEASGQFLHHVSRYPTRPLCFVFRAPDRSEGPSAQLRRESRLRLRLCLSSSHSCFVSSRPDCRNVPAVALGPRRIDRFAAANLESAT
jgi:hypothetical protein